MKSLKNNTVFDTALCRCFIQFCPGFLSNLLQSDKKRGTQVVRVLERLENHPNLGQPLTGQWKGYLKCRSGDYRVIYRVEHHRLMV